MAARGSGEGPRAEESPMASPADRVYSPSHEWHQVSGETLTLGLTQFAVDQLTDVTFVEMKKPGFRIKAGDIVGEVESVKTTSDIYCFVDGEVVEVNGALVDDPGLLNRDPFGKGWLCKVRIADKAGLSGCMDAGSYDKQHG
jgi:glycine cleavage system H protein